MGGIGTVGVGVLLAFSVSGLNLIANAERQMQKLWVTSADGTRVLTSLGSQMVGLAAAAALVGAGIAAVNAQIGNIKAYAVYEESMAHVQGLLNLSRQEMAAFEQASYDMARSTRYTAGETMDAFWELISAGYSQREVLEMVQVTLHGAVIGHMEAAESADMLTSAMKAFQVPAEQARDVMDKLVIGQRYSKIHFDEYSIAFGQFGSIMAATNQDMETAIALFGTIRSAGLEASRASTMVRMLATSLMGLSDAQRGVVREQWGIELIDAATGEMRNMIDILEDMDKAVPDIAALRALGGDISEEDVVTYSEGRLAGFLDIFGRRALAGFFTLRNAMQEVNGEIFYGFDALRAFEGEIRNAGGATEAYYSILAETMNEKIRIIQATVDLLKVQIGQSLAEAALPILEGISKGLRYVSEFLSAHPQVATAIGYIALIGGVLLTVGGIIVGITFVAALLSGVIPILVGVIKLFGIVAAIALVVAAIVTSIILWGEEMGAFFQSVGTWIWVHVLNPIWGVLLAMYRIQEVLSKIVLDYILKPLAVVLIPILAVAFSLVSIIVGFLLIGLRTLWGVVETVLAFVEALLTWDWDGFKTQLGVIWDSVGVDIANIGELFTDTIVRAIMSIPEKIFFGEETPTGFAHGAGILTSRIEQGLGISPNRNWLDGVLGFASGVTEVPRDGLAMLHEGERVSQRGTQEFSSAPIAEHIHFHMHEREAPEEFMRRSYAELQRLFHRDMELMHGV